MLVSYQIFANLCELCVRACAFESHWIGRLVFSSSSSFRLLRSSSLLRRSVATVVGAVCALSRNFKKDPTLQFVLDIWFTATHEIWINHWNPSARCILFDFVDISLLVFSSRRCFHHLQFRPLQTNSGVSLLFYSMFSAHRYKLSCYSGNREREEIRVNKYITNAEIMSG